MQIMQLSQDYQNCKIIYFMITHASYTNGVKHHNVVSLIFNKKDTCSVQGFILTSYGLRLHLYLLFKLDSSEKECARHEDSIRTVREAINRVSNVMTDSYLYNIDVYN